MTTTTSAAAAAHAPQLRRSLTLPLLVFYGLGVTIGAGIYVLIGTAAARGGPQAPLAFLLAAVVMGLTGASLSEFAGRVPSSAGEAAYVRAGFRRSDAALATGLLVFLVAIVSAAAIAKGAAGYLRALVPLGHAPLTFLVLLLAALVAAAGVKEALSVAAVMTVIEILGLVAIIAGGIVQAPAAVAASAGNALALPIGMAAWHGVLGAAMLAVFALIGFESVVNLAEESHTPGRLVPWAIVITLIVATGLYIAVMIVALALFTPAELGASERPLAQVFARATGISPLVVTLIAVAATFNGIIAQIILGARILYGLARQGIMPAPLGTVAARTGVPTIATAVAALAALFLAVFVPLERLADLTSQFMLAVFLAVNTALVVVKRRGDPAHPDAVVVPLAVPILGALLCGATLIASLFL